MNYDNLPSATPTGEDESAAFSCLLTRHWYRKVDTRDAPAATNLLTRIWRMDKVAGPGRDCHTLMIHHEAELQMAVEEAKRQRLGLPD